MQHYNKIAYGHPWWLVEKASEYENENFAPSHAQKLYLGQLSCGELENNDDKWKYLTTG